MAKTAADLKEAQIKAEVAKKESSGIHSRTPTIGSGTVAAPSASPRPTVANAQTTVHPDYRRSSMDYEAGDPRDLPQTNSATAKPYTVGGNSGFPKAENPGSGSGGYRSSGGGSTPNYYTAATLPSATSQADYINTMYDALEAKRKAAFEAEYDARVGALDRQAATIAPQYQQAVNAAAAQSAVSQAAFNERAAAAGINTGAGSQAALAQNNAFVSGVSAIRQAESEALADIEKQRVELTTQYQKAISDAIANNEAERAQALYQEAMRVDESIVNTSINQATENFRAWQARYG